MNTPTQEKKVVPSQKKQTNSKSKGKQAVASVPTLGDNVQPMAAISTKSNEPRKPAVEKKGVFSKKEKEPKKVNTKDTNEVKKIVAKDKSEEADKTLRQLKKEKREKESKKLEEFSKGETTATSIVVGKDKVKEIKEPKPIFMKKKKAKQNIKNRKIVRIETDVKTGLTKEQVQSQIDNGLTNVVNNTNAKTYKSIFIGNICTFFNLLCFAVAAALIAVGSYSNLFFVAVFLCNIVIGIIQEIRAKKTIEKISLITAPTAQLLRNKKIVTVPVEEIVLDDIIFFELGNQVCADSIVLSGAVEVNESLLTGESAPIKKKKGDILYSGSFISSGKCTAQVDKVGDDNYSAKLAAKAKEYTKPKSELLRSLKLIIGCIGVIIIPLAALTYLNNIKISGSVAISITKTAGSIIGMIPAGMFLLTSVALAVGVVKLAKKKTLVQDLYSIEMLARTDVLCLDKTGTITDGTMKVKEVVNFINPQKFTAKEIIGSMLDALEDNNMTSQALALSFGRNKLLSPKILLPFSSANKLSAVTFKEGTYIMGAPEFVYRKHNTTIEEKVKRYAKAGLRVLLVAYSQDPIANDTAPKECIPVALIAIEDHIREDAAATIKWFNDNGVKIKIISGDNPITVSEVSRRVGIENADKYISLEGLSESEVINAAEKYSVFGRVSPEQKCILVKALKSKGHRVAMTGDGVNDILALKEADCSIAMASGSEAARNVSNLVLLDSNFASMPSVVAEGRRVINNISKSSSLFLMKTFMTMFITIFCLITQIEYAFAPNQILLLETFCIGIPAFFLSLQTNKEEIKGTFMSNLISKALPGALILSINVILCYVYDYFVPTLGQRETMASIVMLFTGFVILLRVCKPYDLYRGILVSSTLVISLIALFVLPASFFQYAELTLQNKFFMIILVLCAVYIYPLLIKVCDYMWDFQRNFIEVTRNEVKSVSKVSPKQEEKPSDEYDIDTSSSSINLSNKSVNKSNQE